MRIRIDHSTRYAYARPARFIIQTLRLTPKSSEGQQVPASGAVQGQAEVGKAMRAHGH